MAVVDELRDETVPCVADLVSRFLREVLGILGKRFPEPFTDIDAIEGISIIGMIGDKAVLGLRTWLRPSGTSASSQRRRCLSPCTRSAYQRRR